MSLAKRDRTEALARPSFSRLRSGPWIGASYFARCGALLPNASAPPGLVDSLERLAHPGIDVRRIHPTILPFFLDPGSLVLRMRSRWAPGIGLLWRLARPFARLVGQLVLPTGRAEIATKTVALNPEVDGRADARGVLRSYTRSGAVMQVVAYATCERDGVRLLHATFPIPFGHLAGFLRLDPLGADATGQQSVELTSKASGDDAAIWLVTQWGAWRSPFGESLRLWPSGSELAPGDLDAEVIRGATFVGRHEQTFGGRVLVRHDYGFSALAR